MITGFCRQPDGQARTIASVDELGQVSMGDGAALWLDLEQPTNDEVHVVGRAFNLDADAIDDCLYGEQRPRADDFDNYTFLVLYGAVGPDSSASFDPRKLAMFFGPNLLITVHRQPLRSVPAVRKRVEKNPAHALERGVDFILYAIIDAMVDNYTLVTDACEIRLEELEDRSLKTDLDDRVLADSAGLRRDLLELRRLAVAQREMLTPLARGEYEHVSELLALRFRHVTDHLHDATEVIDQLRDRLHAVRDNYHTALTNRTNAIIKTLTIFAAIMLPLTLVAGIYGMNLPLWPPGDHPASFWTVLAIMLLITGGLLVYFRRRGWL